MNLIYTLRILRKNLLVTVSIVLIMGLAIASCVTMFSFANSILFKSLGYRQSESLIRLRTLSVKATGTQEYPGASVSDLRDIEKTCKSFESIAYYISAPFNVVTPSGEPEIARGLRVSGNFLSLLGVSPQLGRLIGAEENASGKNGVVVLGHGIWQRLWSGDRDVIGKVVRLDDKPVQVIGVMPKQFEFPMGGEFCIPAGLSPGDPMAKDRNRRVVYGLARLAPGKSIEMARAEMEVLSRDLEQAYPDSNAGIKIRLVSLYEETVGNVRLGLYVLLGAVSVFLLLACMNVANLLLATALSRQKEFAIRTALGASYWTIVRQWLLESTVLGTLSGMLGLFLAYFLIKSLLTIAPLSIPRLGEVELGWESMLVAVLLSLLASVFFGLFPGMQLARQRLAETLNEGGKGGSSGIRRAYVRNFLIVSEIALSFVLLVASGLLMKSFYKLNSVETGFNPKNLVATEVALPWERFSNPTNRATWYKGVVDRIKAEPGEFSAGFVSMLPFDKRGLLIEFRVEGRPIPAKGQEDRARYNPVGGDYFQTMQISLLKGRFFDERDTMDQPKVVVVNRTFVTRFLEAVEEPVGKYLHIEGQKEPLQIVGVAGDVRQKSKSDLPSPEIYFHYLQVNDPTMTLVVRAKSSGLTKEAGPLMRRKIREMDAQLAIGKIISMERLVRESTAQSEFRATVINVLAICALVLSAVGLYGIISYLVNQRAQEIGIRMALGAEPFMVKRMILAQGLRLAVFGLAFGLAMAAWFSTYLRAVLYEVAPFDLNVYMLLTVLLVVIAVVASYIPALRAAKLDPIIVMRNS